MVSITETKVLPEKKEEQKKSKLVKYGQTVNLNLGCLGMVSLEFYAMPFVEFKVCRVLFGFVFSR